MKAAATRTHPGAKRAPAERQPVAKAAPPTPLNPVQLQQALETALQAPAFNGDRLAPSVANGAITLRGEVHTAEDKGRATRAARAVAEKGGWGQAHIYNQTTVTLPAE